MRKCSFAKFADKEKAKYLEALRCGNGRIHAAKAAGVSKELVRQYRNATPGWADEEYEAEHEADEKVENALFKMACGNNVAAACAWLYNRQPDRWKDRRKPIDEASMPLDIGRLSDAERKKLAATLDKIIGDSPEGEVAAVERNGKVPH